MKLGIHDTDKRLPSDLHRQLRSFRVVPVAADEAADAALLCCAAGKVRDAVRAVRRQCPDRPLLLTAPHLSPDELIAAFEAGITDYFAEPLQVGLLVERIRAVLARREDPPR